MTYALLIPAAGRGERLVSAVSKALVTIEGKPTIWWAVRSFLEDVRLRQIVIAASKSDTAAIRDLFDGSSQHAKLEVVEGGASRQDSVGKALDVVDPDVELILVHDAARPILGKSTIHAVIDALHTNEAAVPGLPVVDTIKQVNSQLFVECTLPRESLFSIQTPQGIRADVFREAHSLARASGVQCTDDVALVEHFHLGTVKLVPGDPNNFKITHPIDLTRAEALLRKKLSS